MPLGFVGDAITLSGLTGTKLKCDVIGEYYSFWWKITSGGQSQEYKYPTAIVELDAGTGEVYIEDTKETVLGSAGHALNLKMNTPHTENLKVILIEKDRDCYSHLKNVIRRRWPNIPIEETEGPISSNASKIYLLNMNLSDALEKIREIELGNALFFFDPLRSVEYTAIEKVANERINSYYKTGTEFFIFLFTSDWFLGRDDFVPLPTTTNEDMWSEEEKKTVFEADTLFGNKDWRKHILNNEPIESREAELIELYKSRLRRFFRYVLPLPFNPKKNQIFHLILCSNYEDGVKATRNFYSEKTGNPRYSPNNKAAFNRFQMFHPEIFKGLSRNKRPQHWRILWKVITKHEDGVCDPLCKDFEKENIGQNIQERQKLLEWLEKMKYLNQVNIENAWSSPIKQYSLNWTIIKEKLGIDPPLPLKPLSSKEIKYESSYVKNN